MCATREPRPTSGRGRARTCRRRVAGWVAHRPTSFSIFVPAGESTYHSAPESFRALAVRLAGLRVLHEPVERMAGVRDLRVPSPRRVTPSSDFLAAGLAAGLPSRAAAASSAAHAPEQTLRPRLVLLEQVERPALPVDQDPAERRVVAVVDGRGAVASACRSPPSAAAEATAERAAAARAATMSSERFMRSPFGLDEDGGRGGGPDGPPPRVTRLAGRELRVRDRVGEVGRRRLVVKPITAQLMSTPTEPYGRAGRSPGRRR